MIEGAMELGHMRALEKIVAQASADGIKVLQIEAQFANAGLQRFAEKEATRLGGVFASNGLGDTITFVLGH
jgi:hypothetical protein